MTIKNMISKLVLLPLLATLFVSASPAFSATRIMPLGDSITGSPGCWRAYLWQKLQQNGYKNIDFVGTLSASYCNGAADPDNEGHGGYSAVNIANQNQLVGWLSASKPDVVLMHLGTNDVWSSFSTSSILSAYTKLVQQMRNSNPNMKIVVAKIIPMDSSRSCGTCANNVIALNNAIPGWASGLSTSNSPITIVDQWSGFSSTADTLDGVHPTDAGHVKMANKWYPVVANVLSNMSTSTGLKCNWNGTIFPVCANQSSGWGWENNASCVGKNDCANLNNPYGIMGSGLKCNWNGTIFPVCGNQSTGWGWENNASCVGGNDCAKLASPYGLMTGTQKCDFYGNSFPICNNTTAGWGWENNASCVARADCAALPSPYGIK